MYPVRFIILVFLYFIAITAQAQDRSCYDRLRQLGINDYNAGKKEAAIKKWEAAKECSYVPTNNDLDDWIAKAKTSIPPKRQPYEPEMILVEGFYFNMGSNDYDSEKPIHGVTIKDFYIGKYEVTNEQFCAFLNEKGNQIEDGTTWLALESNSCLIERVNGTFKPKFGYAQHPVIVVSWYGAVAYCKWLSEKTSKKYRLLTEAEWEFAACGGKKTNDYKYAGSNNLDEVAWYDENSYDKGNSHPNYGTHPVGQKKANELGIYDMSGNVWEWVQDCWHDNYTGAPTNGSAWTSGECTYRVLRGGSWDYFDFYCRVAIRSWYFPYYRHSLGFRLAQDQ